MSSQSAKLKDKVKKFKIGYGVKVPILSFDESIAILEQAGNTIGYEGALDDLSRKAGNTPTSSIFTKKLAALKNYGLITVTGDKFYITELGQRIVNPTSPEQRAEALLESFLKIEVHRAIYEKYKGKLLPESTFLSNFINKELDIPYELKKDWADYFIAAADYAGILHKRDSGNYQVMARPWTPSLGQNEVAHQLQEEQAQPSITQAQTVEVNRQDLHGGIIESSSWGILNQPRVSGNRKVVIAIPDELTKDDVERIRKILGGTESSLDGLIVEKEETD